MGEASHASSLIGRVEVMGLGRRFAGSIGERHQLALSAFDVSRAEAPIVSAVQPSSTDSIVARVSSHGILTGAGSGGAYIRGATESGGCTLADSVFLVFVDSIRLAASP